MQNERQKTGMSSQMKLPCECDDCDARYFMFKFHDHDQNKFIFGINQNELDIFYLFFREQIVYKIIGTPVPKVVNIKENSTLASL